MWIKSAFGSIGHAFKEAISEAGEIFKKVQRDISDKISTADPKSKLGETKSPLRLKHLTKLSKMISVRVVNRRKRKLNGACLSMPKNWLSRTRLNLCMMRMFTGIL